MTKARTARPRAPRAAGRSPPAGRPPPAGRSRLRPGPFPPAFFAFVLFCLAGASFAAFEMRSLNVSISLNADGSAHVTESLRLFISTTPSIALYEQSSKYNDLSSWSTRTEIPDVSTHVDWGSVEIRNLQVNPEKKSGCNMVANTCYGRLQIDYDLYPLSTNGSGAQKLVFYKPRTTRYIFQSSILTFPHSNTGDILLPKDVGLSLSVPEDAVRISLSPVPSNLADQESLFKYDTASATTYYLGGKRVFVWTDPTLPKFWLSYEREDSLEGEVLAFFSGIQKGASATLLSNDGLAYLLALSILLLSLFWLHSLSPQ